MERWIPGSGLVVLGTPINFPGTFTFAEGHCRATLGSLRVAIERVTGGMDPQSAHHLIRKCLDSCRLNHLLRSTNSYDFDAFMFEADEVILGGFEDILGCSLPPAQRAQASLPLSTGGCGLRCPVQVRPAARIAALVTFLTGGGPVEWACRSLHNSAPLPGCRRYSWN